MATELPLAVRPRWRGHSHQWAFVASAIAGAALLTVAPTTESRLAVGVYVATLCALFGVSAAYHRVTWGALGRARMKRLDHSTIFVFIAGSYTPVALLAVGGSSGNTLLGLVWAGAALGVARIFCWPGAPKALIVSLYLALGWLIVAYAPAVMQRVDGPGQALFAAGGLLYSAGAIVYGVRRPNPWPAAFGYHEIFHALVVVACACHFVAIARLVNAG